MDKLTCSTCKYFLQHYVLGERHIFRVYCGHCTYSKAKRRLPGDKACEHYLTGEPDEAAFVRKEYLSKALLEYVLNMELLPEIQDAAL